MNVDGITIARALEIENASVVSGRIAAATGHLILTTRDGTEMDGGLVVPETQFISPALYGAVGDGVTDDTDAINLAALDGSVQFEGLRYKINGTVTFPADKSQIGVGSGNTVFVMGPSGKILLGDTVIVPADQAGKTGGFTIEGDGITPVGMHIACVGRGRIVEDVFIRNCVTNLFVEGSQNVLFLGMDVAQGEYGVVLDRGAGGNHFIGLQTLDQSSCGLEIRNSGDPAFNTPGTYYPSTLGCTDNHFTKSRFEIPRATAKGSINIVAGFRNQFHNCLVSGQGLDGTKSAIILGTGDGVATTYTLFENCNIQGDGTCGAGATANQTGGYQIFKNCIITGFVKMFKAASIDFFWCDSVFPQNVASADYFGPVSGHASTVLTAFRGPDPTPWVAFAASTWDENADVPMVRRVGPRAEMRGIAQALASGTIPTTIGTIPNAVSPADDRIATFTNRGEDAVAAGGAETIQIAATSVLTNANANGKKLFFDGISYDVDQ